MRKLNVKLLVGLLVGTAVLVVAVYFIHDAQVGRNADSLLARGKEYSQAGNYDEGMKYLRRYLRYCDRDTDKWAAGWSALADTARLAAEDPAAARKVKLTAYYIIDQAVQEVPNDAQMRRQLVDYQMEVVYDFKGALQSIDSLLSTMKDEQQRVELEVLRARCLLHQREQEQSEQLFAELIGFDREKGTIDSSKARGRNQVDAYYYMAIILNSDPAKTAERNAVVERMVAENPEAYKAYVYRATFHQQDEHPQEARADLEKAIQLAPEKNRLDVVLSLARLLASEKQFEEAEKLMAEAREKHAKDERVWSTSATVALMNSEVDRALKLVEEGTQKASDPQLLFLLRAEIQLQERDLEGMNKTLEILEQKADTAPFLLAYYRANLKLAEGNYVAAAEAFQKIQSEIADRPELREKTGILLAQCYEQLRRLDLALEAYENVLALNPGSVVAKLRKAQIELAQGKSIDQVQLALDTLPTGEEAEENPALPGILTTRLQIALNKQLSLPEDKRDWREVDALAEQLGPQLTPGQQEILRAELLLNRGQFAEARKLLDKQRAESPKEFAAWLASANLEMKENGLAAALQMLDQGEASLGDSLRLRAARVGMVLKGTEEEKSGAKGLLNQLEQGIEQFSPEEQKTLLQLLGTAHIALDKDLAAADRLWSKAAAAFPDDPALQLSRFELARDRQDEQGMQTAIAEIKRILGENSAEAQFAEAARTVALVRMGKADQESLDAARTRIQQAQANRPGWQRLAHLAAEIDLIRGSVEAAKEGWQEVLRKNPSDHVVAMRLFRIALVQQDFVEAQALIASLGPGPFDTETYRFIAEVQAVTGHPKEAAEAAEKAAPADSKNPEDHLWHASLMRRLDRTDDAERAMKRAINQAPERLEHWLPLLDLYLVSEQRDKLEPVVQLAEKKLPADQLPLFRAMVQEMVLRSAGRPQEAETYYKAALDARPDDLATLRAAASFYVRLQRGAEALPLLERMIEQADREPEKYAEDLAWARRVQAQEMAASGTYTQFQEAIRLLDSTAAPGQPLGPQEMLMKALLLSRRPEPESWLAGRALFNEIAKQRALSAGEKHLLAALEQKAGNLAEARRLMLSALAQEPNNVEFVSSFVQLLLDEGKPDEAMQYVGKLEKLNPTDVKVFLLKAQVLSKQGKTQEAVSMLTGLIPTPLPPEQALVLKQVAMVCESFEHYAEAEQLFNEYAAKSPRGVFDLAGYLGRRGRVDEAFALLDKVLRKNTVLGITELAIATLRSNRGKITPEQFAKVENWLLRGLHVDPNQFLLKLRLAELRELEGRDEEVIKLYNELLVASEGADVLRRAVVLNNLAFFSAVKDGKGDEALRLVNEAIKVLGPTSELLDTRAMAHLARGDAQSAITDLKLAMHGSDEPLKHFHLAVAYQRINDLRAAADHLQQAEDKKLNPDLLSPAEKVMYEQLIRQVKAS